VRNSVLFFNGDGDLGCDPEATCTVEYSDLEHAWPGPGNISEDPAFVNRLGGDYHLLDSSPCLETASLDYAPDHDIDGESRPFDADGDGNALPDMGADEYHTTLHLWKMKLNWAYAARPGYVKLVALGIVHDARHLRVNLATVSGFWTLPDGTQMPDTAVTDYLGRWKFRYKGPWMAPGTYRFDVTGIAYDDYGYDPGANETDPWREVTIPAP
jgi:hypothetical protein